LGRPLMASELVGRASEIAVVESLLAGIADGGGSLLVLGDPGIGKSALVAATRRAADAGMRVLACAGVPSEAQFSFAGLHQLLRPVLAETDGLPRGQRDALLTALGVAEGPAPSIPLIGLATLELLAGLAERTPLLVVAEDLFTVCAGRSPPGMPTAGRPRCSPSPAAAGRIRCHCVRRLLPGRHLVMHRPVPSPQSR
jgi:hypothetical protein